MRVAGPSRMWASMLAAGLLVVLATMQGPAAAESPIRLQLPLNCQLNQDCFVQNYFDHDTGKGAQDYTCGSETNHGQNGTDLRVPDLSPSRDLTVRAAAVGRVLRARDGMPDVSVRKTGETGVAGKECGNGLVIDHGGSWQTQYCHLAKGSVAVHPGDLVFAGQRVGRVGMSGMTEFPHVHVTVNFEGKPIDPFAFGWDAGRCGSGEVLWDLPQGRAYQTDFVINAGFATDRVTIDDIQSGILEQTSFTSSSPALLAVVLAGGLSRGSVLELTLVGPDGGSLATKSVGPLAGPMAQYWMAIGKRRPDSGWPSGVYRATFRMINGSATTEKRFEVKL